MSDTEAISTDLTELVQSTPGVRIVYDAASTIGRVLDKVVDLVTGRESDPSPVVVKEPTSGTQVRVLDKVVDFVTGRESDPNPAVVKEPTSGTQVRVSIGVSDEESASEVCRRVHDAVAAYLQQQGDEATEISVKVSSIG